MSSVAPKRLRLIPPLALLGFAGLLVFLLVLAFPRTSLQQRLLGNAKADDLAVAYLEAWQRVEPHNTDVMTTLSREYLKGNRPGDAAQLLASLRASPDPVARQNALLIEIGLAQSALFAAKSPAQQPQKQAALAALLVKALPLHWDLRQLEALADTARLGGASAVAGRYYARLAQQDTARAAYWLDKSAQLLLAQGQYRDAAQSYFLLQQKSDTLALKRHYFIAALGALQMGNLLPDAMQAAQQHAGDLLADAATLRYLTKLALASGRPDLAQFYVQKLLSAHPQSRPAASAARGTRSGWLPVVWTAPSAPRVISDWQDPQQPKTVVLVDPARYMPSAASRKHNPTLPATGLLPVAGHSTPVEDYNPAQDLDLAFRVFMANGNLAGAEKIARQALTLKLNAALWRPRLAQVALWNHDPATSLSQYLVIGQQTQDPKVWQEIARLAQALNDAPALLAVSLHASASHPGDMALLDKVVTAYEQAGEPERAMAWLLARRDQGFRQPVLERIASLALRMGHDQQALESYQALERSYGPDPRYALKLSQLYYQRTQFKAALAALDPARSRASGNKDFWTAYATLAALTQQPQKLAQANQQLLASGVQDPGLLSQMVDAANSRPLDAARIAEYGYRQNGRSQALARAVDAYNRGRAFARASQLLASLTPEAQAQAEKDPDFLVARSEFWRQTGHPDAARSDIEAALVLAPGRLDLRAGYLWLLIEQGSDVALSAALQRYAADADDSAQLIGVYAAAYLRLGQARQALHYFRLDRGAREQDPLWLLSLAEALELNQQHDSAWRMRRHVWLDLLPRRLKSLKQQDSRSELAAAYAVLTDGFAGGDRSLGQLRRALAQDTEPETEQPAMAEIAGMPPAAQADQRMSPALRDAALAWMVSHNAYAQERDWLARQYASWLAQPAAAQYSLALAENDQPALKRLLSQKRDQLPLESRIESLVAQDQPEEAESLVFAAQDRDGRNDGLNATLRERLLASAQALSFGWKTVRQGGLKYEESSLGAGMRLSSSQSLNLLFDQRHQRVNRLQFPAAPGLDHTLSLSYQQHAAEHSERLTIGQHQGWRATTPVLFEASVMDTQPLSFTAALGHHQSANETSVLLLGGMKDLLRLGASWRSQSHWFASGQAEVSRYYLQDGSFLGDGGLLSLDTGYKFKTDYPDATLHAVFTHGQYSAYGRPAQRPLFLQGEDSAAFSQRVMPQTFTQSGLLLSMGTDLPEGYSHAFRPYLELGPVYDTHAHWGLNTRFGLVGSVLGGDRLNLYYQHQDMSAQGSSAVTEVGVRYSWFY